MAIGYLLDVHGFTIRRGCESVGISRAAYYRNLCLERPEDQDVIEALNALVAKRPRWGFWKCFKALKRTKHPWNHKRVYRVYCGLKLNQKRRAKKRIPQRMRQPLTVRARPNEVWSADFMSDALYGGSRFRTFNVMDGVRLRRLCHRCFFPPCDWLESCTFDANRPGSGCIGTGTLAKNRIQGSHSPQ